MASVPTIAKPLIRVVLHQLGGLAVLRRSHRHGFRILMYHRFPDGEDTRRTFVAQCEHFRRYYQPVTLDQIADSLESGAPLPPNSLAITVDDGYRDFLERGFDVFQAHDWPVTMFLVSDFIDKRCWLWPDVVSYVMSNTRRDGLHLALKPGTPEWQYAWSGGGERDAARLEIKERAKKLPNELRLKLIEELPVLLEVELPQNPPVGMQPLTWDEVRALTRKGVKFGAHTKTHPILSRIASTEGQRHEIEESQRRLEAELGCAVRHFCYPNGSPEDFDQTSLECAKSLGFRTAVTTIRGFNYSDAQPLMLRRFGMEPGSPLPFALERAEGLHG